tara:strand:- start:292 stop:774 length:483 start_codon:yes stop_codon:yes gene_type:complete
MVNKKPTLNKQSDLVEFFKNKVTTDVGNYYKIFVKRAFYCDNSIINFKLLQEITFIYDDIVHFVELLEKHLIKRRKIQDVKVVQMKMKLRKKHIREVCVFKNLPKEIENIIVSYCRIDLSSLLRNSKTKWRFVNAMRRGRVSRDFVSMDDPRFPKGTCLL